MNKWQAIVAVVQSFNEKDRPGLALVAAVILSLPIFGMAMLVVSVFD